MDSLYFIYENYIFKNYGRLGNRPFNEIFEKANKEIVKQTFDWTSQRYIENEANKRLGFCNAERVVWLESVNAKTKAELMFGWQVEICLAKTFKDLDKIIEEIKI